MSTCQLKRSSAEIIRHKLHKVYWGGVSGVMCKMRIEHRTQNDPV